ncbi:MAG: TauD/TfdA family dioxygenase [Anaerolineales bacterium]
MSQKQWVKTEKFFPDKDIPLMITPAMDGIDLVEWARNNRPYIEKLLAEHHALLFRGFNVKSPEEFEAFINATSDGDLLKYVDRTTPRHSEGGKSGRVYISTIYPPEHAINAHNEGTYWTAWAMKLYFCCLVSPEQGGETPIFDVHKVYHHIDPDTRERFIRKKWMLVRNYNDGFGLPWQEVFQANDREEVESYCRDHAIEYEWKGEEQLQTRSIRPAVQKHPKTGEPLWFNHAIFYHHTTLAPAMREALVSEFTEEGLPYNTWYGDGTPIAPDDAENIRQAYRKEKVKFRWQEGDVTLLDNMYIAHAREPYVGDRRVLVGMTEPVGSNAYTLTE